MAKPKSIQDRLAAGNSPNAARSRAAPNAPSFGKKLLRHPDVKEASAMVAEQAGYESDQQYGLEAEQLDHEIGELDNRYKMSCKALDALEKKLSGTKRYIKSGRVMSGKDDGPVRWKDWRAIDQILICVLVVFLAIALVMGAGNVYANLVSSNPVFIEDPWLAVMLSMLVPIASTAIKFVTNFMHLDSSRKTYAVGVYSLTLMFLLAWGVLFSLNFTGVSGGVDWGNLGGDSGTGSALVAVQLFCEVLAAASLFLACEEVYIRYAPYVWMQNTEYLETQKTLEAHKVVHKRLSEERGKKHGRRVELRAVRQAYINEQVADFFHLRARYSAANDPRFNA